MKVGIPRALLYHKYFSLWKRFFKELGVEVVVSPPTNKTILTQGLKIAESELCLPVKVFYGHVFELKDKVDGIFIPRIVSVEKKAYTCPKFLGLPDMIRALGDGFPEIITATFNLKLGLKKFYTALYEVGKRFTKNPLKVYAAFQKGMKDLKIKTSHHLDKGRELGKERSSSEVRLGLIGHPYNLYDSYTSMNLIDRLKKQGVKIFTLENISEEDMEKEVAALPKDLFWTYEKEIVGAAFYWLHTKMVDGVIYVLSFACGPDSLIQVLLEDEARKKAHLPFLPLVIDEHSAEAGLVTRLEAFLDMVKRKNMKN